MNSKSCVTLNSINDTTNWNNASDGDPINIYPIVFPPLLTYTEQDMTNGTIRYTYCGSLIILMKTFAQYINRE